MGVIVQFSNKAKQDNDYVDKCLDIATCKAHIREPLAALLRAAYDDNYAVFRAVADEFFANRDALVDSAWGFHSLLKTEVEEAGNEYPTTLRAPKGYDWVHTED